jgi:hypothetical protein
MVEARVSDASGVIYAPSGYHGEGSIPVREEAFQRL